MYWLIVMTDCMLCQNMSCERFPPDWDFEEDTEETYEEGQWRKCVLCPGYFNDDGWHPSEFAHTEWSEILHRELNKRWEL